MATKFSRDGSITKGEASPEALEQLERKREGEARKFADANTILSGLTMPNDEEVVEKQISHKGDEYIFSIRRLSHPQISLIRSKKYRRGDNSPIIVDSDNESNYLTAWLIHFAVVANNNGKWEPLFSMPDLIGSGNAGLMNSADPDARDLIYSLQEAIRDVNGFEKGIPNIPIESIKGAVEYWLENDPEFELRLRVAKMLRNNSGIEEYVFGLDQAFCDRVDSYWQALNFLLDRKLIKISEVAVINL